MFFLFIGISSDAQKAVLSDDFQEKITELGLEFYFPIEQKIKIKESITDEYLHYDLVLRSKNNFELKYILDPLVNAENGVIHPRVRLSTIVSTLATNDQEEQIMITEIAEDKALHTFGAEWGVYADFIPKKSFSHYPYGRIVSLFHAEKGAVNCIILHKDEKIDGFLGMPLSFSVDEQTLDSNY